MLTKSIKLLNYIDKKGYSVKTLASMLGINENLLIQKIKGRKEFKADEIVALAHILEMYKDQMLDIFFDW